MRSVTVVVKDLRLLRINLNYLKRQKPNKCGKKVCGHKSKILTLITHPSKHRHHQENNVRHRTHFSWIIHTTSVHRQYTLNLDGNAISALILVHHNISLKHNNCNQLFKDTRYSFYCSLSIPGDISSAHQWYDIFYHCLHGISNGQSTQDTQTPSCQVSHCTVRVLKAQ